MSPMARSQFCHWYMQAVPGSHPQLLPVRCWGLSVALGVPVFVVVNTSLLLLIHAPAAVAVNRDLGNVIFGAETCQVCDGPSHGAAGGLLDRDVHISRNTHAYSVFRVLPWALNATDGGRFFMRHTQLL